MFSVNDFAERHYKIFTVEKLYILPFHLTVGSSFSTSYLYGEHEYTRSFQCFIMLYVWIWILFCSRLKLLVFAVKVMLSEFICKHLNPFFINFWILFFKTPIWCARTLLEVKKSTLISLSMTEYLFYHHDGFFTAFFCFVPYSFKGKIDVPSPLIYWIEKNYDFHMKEWMVVCFIPASCYASKLRCHWCSSVSPTNKPRVISFDACEETVWEYFSIKVVNDPPI